MNKFISVGSMIGWSRKRKNVQSSWSASAYLTKNRVVIHSTSRTHNNIGWYNQPVFGLDRSAPSAAVGADLRAALNASTWNSETDDSTLASHPVPGEAGFATWRELEVKSRFVIIDTDKVTVSLHPTRAAKDRGFVGMSDQQAIEIEWHASDEELGTALLNAFKASTCAKKM